MKFYEIGFHWFNIGVDIFNSANFNWRCLEVVTGLDDAL